MRKLISDKQLEKMHNESIVGYEDDMDEWMDENYPDDFMSIFRWQTLCSGWGNFSGTYVLWNVTKNKYYVGQSKHVPFRINQHIQGKGNPHVYFDIRSGDEFAVRLIPLNPQYFATPDEQERYYIYKYNAYSHGYNRNSGNKK